MQKYDSRDSGPSRTTGLALSLLRATAERLFATPLHQPAPPRQSRFEQNFTRLPVSSATPAVRDATSVKVPPVEELGKLQARSDKRAKEEFLEKSRRSLGTITNADPNSIRIQANLAAQKTLKDMFGDKLGAFLWITRGGGEDDVTMWSILNALEGYAPIQTGSGLRNVHQTESTR